MKMDINAVSLNMARLRVNFNCLLNTLGTATIYNKTTEVYSTGIS